MDNELISLKIQPVRELYYGNDFGVYAARTDDDITGVIELNSYGNFIITGQVPRLVIDHNYDVQLRWVKSKKYGKTLEVVTIRDEIPKTIDAQHAYLRSILTEYQAERLIEAYPHDDIIELIKNNELDYKKVYGLGEYTYNLIRNKVLENIEIQEALVELSPFGITYKAIKKLIAHFNNSPTMVVQKIKENPYVICEVSGFGFTKVDEYALRMGIEKDSPFRINTAIDYILQQEESEGHCWISKADMFVKLEELTNIDSSTLLDHFANKRYDINAIYIDEHRIGSKKLYNYEKYISIKLMELLKDSGNFKVDNIEERIKQVEKEQGFEFTDEQRTAIYKAVESNVLIISGKAGVGKSTILKGIMRVLSGYSYETCAFSGKAAQRIVESTGLTSQTIHRLLKYDAESGKFTYGLGNPLDHDIIVLDEASMVNVNLFFSLISAIKPGGKFIIQGDVEQLPPIGAGLVLKDMINSNKVPVVELTKVHRQALKSGILLAANEVREGNQITAKGETEGKVLGELKDLYIIPKAKDEEIVEYIKELCIKTKDRLDLMDFQVIVPLKSKGVLSAKNLNIVLQEIFNPPTMDRVSVKCNGYELRIGDKVIQCGNNYDVGVFNGTLGFIRDINTETEEVSIDFVGSSEPVIYTYDELKQIDMAYALTVHRCQGSQFKDVIFALNFAAYVLLSRQLTYTALTRASGKCVVVCENNALRFAISKNQISKRNTFLKEFLDMVSAEHSDEHDEYEYE